MALQILLFSWQEQTDKRPSSRSLTNVAHPHVVPNWMRDRALLLPRSMPLMSSALSVNLQHLTLTANLAEASCFIVDDHILQSAEPYPLLLHCIYNETVLVLL